ncbi:hypothetical protein KUL113_38360 [Tenacibaculum sp. KUL113]|nr:hypothetical protein KUL113_38360 [Tenacibaculum sp. KUL113]
MRRDIRRKCFLAITITGLLACSPKAVEEIITEAETLTAKGDFREAVLEYKSAISMQPSDSDLRRKVADLYMILGDYATAEKEYSKALELDSESSEALEGMINSLFSQFDFEGVILLKDLHETLVDKVDEKTALNIALSYIELGESVNANLVVRNKVSDADLVATFESYRQASKGKYEDAYALINKINQDSLQPSALLLKGRLAFLKRDFHEASKNFESYLYVKPSTFKVEVYLINSLVLSNEIEHAAKELTNLKTKVNSHPVISLLDAEVALAKADYSSAKKHAEAAIKERLESSRLNYVYAVASFKEGAFEAAFRALEKLPNSYRKTGQIQQIEMLTRAKLGYDIDIVDYDVEKFSFDETKALAETFSGANYSGLMTELKESILSKVNESEDIGSAEKAYWNLKFGNEEIVKSQLTEDLRINNQPADAAYLLAFAHFRSNELDQAEKVAKEGLKSEPNNTALLSVLAQSLFKQGKFDESLEAAKLLRTIKSDHRVPVVLSVAFHLQKNEYENARNEVKNFIESFNDQSEFEPILYVLNREIGDTDSNVQYFSKLYENKPAEGGWKLYLSSLIDKGDYGAALKELNRVTKENKDDFFFLSRTSINLRVGNFSEAKNDLNNWINSFDAPLEAYVQLCNILELEKNIGTALTVSRKAHQKFANSADARLLRAHFELAVGNSSNAKVLLDGINENDFVSSSGYWNSMARLELQNNNFAKALELFEKAYQLEPSAKLLSNRLAALRALGKENEALDYLKSSLELTPSDTILKRYYADALISVNATEAINQYKALIDSGVKDVVVFNNLAWLYFEVESFQRAEKYIQDALKLEHGYTNGNVLSTASSIYLATHQYKKLESTFEKGLEMGARVFAGSLLNLAEAKIRLNKIEEARKILEQTKTVDKDLTDRKSSLLSLLN